jgi:hypothetical protein
MRQSLDLALLNSLVPPITIGTAPDTAPSPPPLFNAHVFALHLLFPLPSPPLLAVRPMMMNTETSLLRIPEDLRPVRQVLMRK